jgi:hypothetical protein
MNMEMFWVYVMYAAVFGYFGMGIIISIGGWFDVWKMLRRLASAQQAVRDR